MLADEPDLTTLLSAIDKSGLLETIDVSANYTLFAPTDSASNDLSLERYMQPDWKYHLRELLNFHISPRALLVDEIVDGMNLKTLAQSGETVKATIGPNGRLSFSSGQELSFVTFMCPLEWQELVVTPQRAFSDSRIVQSDMLTGSNNPIVERVHCCSHDNAS